MPATESGLAHTFRDTAQRVPDRVALAHEDTRLTYAELLAEASAAADRIAELAGDRVPVAVTVARTPASVVAVLATIIAGRPYLPMDSAYPQHRKDFMLADSGAAVHVDGSGERLSVTAVGPGDQRTEVPEGTAYVLYTSGSTGPPKGCLVSHANVLSLLAATRDRFALAPSDVCSVVHSLAFDFSVWELWTAWSVGGTAWLAGADTVADPHLLVTGLAEHGVTRFSATPSLFTHVVRALARGGTHLPALRSVVLGGEAVRLRDVIEFVDLGRAPGARIVNMYGITETTVHVTHRELTGDERPHRADATPIGRPIDSLAISLRDQDGVAVPAGETGEMWIRGAGVCAGYLRRPELTTERFVVDGGERWYRSGDLAVDDGTELHYLGRLDRQVELNGFRTELGEVEAVMDAHPEVLRSVAAVEHRQSSASAVLVAYVHCGPEARESLPAVLRAALTDRLPAHAIPRIIRTVPRIPLTTNGKVDVAALRELSAAPPPPVRDLCN